MIKLEDFIRLGFIPEEVIPCINTERLSNIVTLLLNSNIKKIGPNTSKCCEYNIPRIRNLRRHLGIPNPLHQIILFKTLSDNWTDIDSFISSTKLSLSRPVIDLTGNRAVTRYCKFPDLKFRKALLTKGARYIFKTDVSRYYPTIYTHSIPWALHSKPKAKLNKKGNLLGNRIDKNVRNTQEGQSIGIPIGPDSSLIISEIIGKAMDLELFKKIGKNKINGYRYMDDYNLYFESLSEAEEANYTIYNIMRYYELECNPGKTEILEIPELLEEKWVQELKLFKFRASRGQDNDLISFFSNSFKWFKTFPDEPILKYALSRIKGLRVIEKNWKLYESFILESIIADPSVLPIASDIFATYKSINYKLDKRKILRIISQIIMHFGKYNYSFELSWILWITKILGIKINKKIANELLKVNDPTVVLICLDLKESGLIPKDIDTTLWQSFMTLDHLYSDKWLLAYEALKKNWLSSSDRKNYLKKDKFFSILEANNVEFYDIKIRPTPIKLKQEYNSKYVTVKTEYGNGT